MKNKLKSIKADAKYYLAAAAIAIPAIVAGGLAVRGFAKLDKNEN